MNTPREVKDWWQRYWGWMLIAGAVAASLVYYTDVRDAEARSRCQAEYNQTFAEVVNLRAESAGSRQSALDELIQGISRVVINPPTTEAEQKRAAKEYSTLFKRYDESVRESDAVRAANPYPKLPDCRV